MWTKRLVVFLTIGLLALNGQAEPKAPKRVPKEEPKEAPKEAPKEKKGANANTERQRNRCKQLDKSTSVANDPDMKWAESWDGSVWYPPVKGNMSVSGWKGMRSFGYTVPYKDERNPKFTRAESCSGSVIWNKFAKGGSPRGKWDCGILTAAHCVVARMKPKRVRKPGKPRLFGGKDGAMGKEKSVEAAKLDGDFPKVTIEAIQLDKNLENDKQAEFSVNVMEEYYSSPSNSDLDSAVLMGTGKACSEGLAEAIVTPPCDPGDLAGSLYADGLRNGGAFKMVLGEHAGLCDVDEVRMKSVPVPRGNPNLKRAKNGRGGRPGLKLGLGSGDSGTLAWLKRKNKSVCAYGSLYGTMGGLVELSDAIGLSTPHDWLAGFGTDKGGKPTAVPLEKDFVSVDDGFQPHVRSGFHDSLTH